jgi:hypothetical protein
MGKDVGKDMRDDLEQSTNCIRRAAQDCHGQDGEPDSIKKLLKGPWLRDPPRGGGGGGLGGIGSGSGGGLGCGGLGCFAWSDVPIVSGDGTVTSTYTLRPKDEN